MKATSTRTETLVDRLLAHANSVPQKNAYTFLRDEGGQSQITFASLDEHVRIVGSALRDRFAEGERVLLLFPAGLEFVVGFLSCLAAGLIAVPAYPPRKNRSISRLQAILQDAGPIAILTTDKIHELVAKQILTLLPGLDVLSIEEISRDGAYSTHVHHPSSTAIAFLQYTSGSTGSPRGVAVTHANLMANEQQIQLSFGHTPQSVMVSWLPLFHDMGLVGGVLQPLYLGGAGVLLSPISFLREPIRWLKAVSDFAGTTTGAPNFAYGHCVASIDEEQKKGIDLTSLEVAYNGAEPVRADTLRQFATAFSGCGFRPEAFFPCYGLAESTLFVSGGPVKLAPRVMHVCSQSLEGHRVVEVSPGTSRSHSLVSSGKIGLGTQVIVVDPETRISCPRKVVGEIWLASASVAQGYWNNESETLSTFRAVVQGGDDRHYLRTGDWGFVEGGELFITGRTKDLIIVRGRNLYPQDIEAAVEKVIPHASANSVAAFGVNTDDGELPAVVIECHRRLIQTLVGQSGVVDGVGEGDLFRVAKLVDRVREIVAREFDVALGAVCFVKPGSFFRTSSGKLQRQACKAGLIEGTLDSLTCWKSPRFRNEKSSAVVDK